MSDTLEDIDTSQLDNVGRVKVDTPSNVTILDITEDCTRLVFDRLTLNQLIHLRAVCHPWNDIIKDICEHKSSLQLTFTKIGIPLTELLNLHKEPQFQIGRQNLLFILQKGASSVRRLKRNRDDSLCEVQPDLSIGIRFVARLFPNITNFFCDFQYDRMLELNYILWKWSTNLDTLAIFAYNYENNARICKNTLQDFVQCFRMMSSLRRFYLYGNDNKLLLPNVPTFGQLEEFMFINYYVDFSPYFAQLDANRCKILRVGYHSDVWNTSLNLSKANPELASKLTHLAMHFILPNHISLHYSEFRNLIHLDIVDILHGNSMADVLQQIVPLQKLEILALSLRHLSSDKMEEYSIDNPNYRHTFPIFDKTVTELHLLDNISINSSFLKFHEYKLLAKIFPRVKKIGIYTTSVQKLNKTTFDSKYRPQFSEAFGERVELTFFPSKILTMSDFDSIMSRV